ncbi:MAG: hypothetical protein I4N51_05775 [Acinetobacter sp.]|nr:hypothetical protein [Acinetobacter sp.]
MAKNKIKRVTKPIGFRLEDETVDAISKAAKEKGITIQEYFLSQIRPGSELDHILQAEQERMLLQSQNIAQARDRMANEALQLRESLGLSEEAFELAAMQALQVLIRSNKGEQQ